MLITKPLPPFPMYSISPSGIVVGQLGRRIKPYRHPSGYMKFSPSVNGKMYQMLVHRAVLLTWEGSPPDEERICACHKDGVRDHNFIGNLYWGSYKQNWEDRRRHGNDGRGLQNGRSKMTQELSDELRSMYSTGEYSYQNLADHFGISQAQANKIGRGLYWPALHGSDT